MNEKERVPGNTTVAPEVMETIIQRQYIKLIMNVYIFQKDEKNNTKKGNFHMDSKNNANLDCNQNKTTFLFELK